MLCKQFWAIIFERLYISSNNLCDGQKKGGAKNAPPYINNRLNIIMVLVTVRKYISTHLTENDPYSQNTTLALPPPEYLVTS